MKDDLENDLNQAKKDYNKFKEEFEKARDKNEKLMENLESLKQKNHVLEKSLQQQKKSLEYYVNADQDLDKRLESVKQQQNKAAVAAEFTKNMLSEYRDALTDNAAPSTSRSSTGRNNEKPSFSSETYHKELTTAIEENRKQILDILEKIGDLHK